MTAQAAAIADRPEAIHADRERFMGAPLLVIDGERWVRLDEIARPIWERTPWREDLDKRGAPWLRLWSASGARSDWTPLSELCAVSSLAAVCAERLEPVAHDLERSPLSREPIAPTIDPTPPKRDPEERQQFPEPWRARNARQGPPPKRAASTAPRRDLEIVPRAKPTPPPAKAPTPAPTPKPIEKRDAVADAFAGLVSRVFKDAVERTPTPTPAATMGELVARAGLSQCAVSRLADVPQSQISRYCRGISSPSAETLERIRAALGLTREDVAEIDTRRGGRPNSAEPTPAPTPETATPWRVALSLSVPGRAIPILRRDADGPCYITRGDLSRIYSDWSARAWLSSNPDARLTVSTEELRPLYPDDGARIPSSLVDAGLLAAHAATRASDPSNRARRRWRELAEILAPVLALASSEAATPRPTTTPAPRPAPPEPTPKRLDALEVLGDQVATLTEQLAAAAARIHALANHAQRLEARVHSLEATQ